MTWKPAERCNMSEYYDESDNTPLMENNFNCICILKILHIENPIICITCITCKCKLKCYNHIFISVHVIIITDIWRNCNNLSATFWPHATDWFFFCLLFFLKMNDDCHGWKWFILNDKHVKIFDKLTAKSTSTIDVKWLSPLDWQLLLLRGREICDDHKYKF